MQYFKYASRLPGLKKASFFQAFNWLGRSAENSGRKSKKSAARGSVRTPVSKLNRKVVPVYQDLEYPLIGQF